MKIITYEEFISKRFPKGIDNYSKESVKNVIKALEFFIDKPFNKTYSFHQVGIPVQTLNILTVSGVIRTKRIGGALTYSMGQRRYFAKRGFNYGEAVEKLKKVLDNEKPICYN
jgi:hypothetical protein